MKFVDRIFLLCSLFHLTMGYSSTPASKQKQMKSDFSKNIDKGGKESSLDDNLPVPKLRISSCYSYKWIGGVPVKYKRPCKTPIKPSSMKRKKKIVVPKPFNPVIKRSSDSTNLTPSFLSISKRSTDQNAQNFIISTTYTEDCRPSRNHCIPLSKCPPNHFCAMNLECTQTVCVPTKSNTETSSAPDTTEPFTRNTETTQDTVVTEPFARSTETTQDTVVTTHPTVHASDANTEAPDTTEPFTSNTETTKEVVVNTRPTGHITDTTTYCPKNNFYPCHNGNCNKDDFSCDCNVGWFGHKCDKPCNLPCVHGDCKIRTPGKRPEDITEDDMYCNCPVEWINRLCDEPRPDLKAIATAAKRKANTAQMIANAAQRRTVRIGVSLGVTLFLVITVCSAIFYLMWRKRVVVVMRLVYFFKPQEDNDGKLYDAYISMGTSSRGLNFVRSELCPMLEQFGFNLYVQARDQLIGEALDESIITAMSQSRRTILIVTPEYVQNDWSIFECRIAQIETLKLHQRIVPIILEDIATERHGMSKSLKHILDSVKCLTYPMLRPDPNANLKEEEAKRRRKEMQFWRRLKLTMPKKRTSTTSASSEPETPATDISSIFSSPGVKSDLFEPFQCDDNGKPSTAYTPSIFSSPGANSDVFEPFQWGDTGKPIDITSIDMYSMV